MAVIGLCGPHAIGKTTAVNRWIVKYPGLVAAIADNQWEADCEGRVRVLGWKGTIAEKQVLVEYHQSRAGITVIDSVRTTNLNYFSETDPVIMVICDWARMGKVLRERCERNNKKFNEAYWTEWKLGYESSRRYLNFANLKLKPSQVKCFKVNEYTDWAAVDEYFGQVYRRLHNGLVRSKV